MNKLFKLLVVLFVFAFCSSSSFAFSVAKLDKEIKSSDLYDTSTVAISVRNLDNNNVVYELNQNKLLHPASTLKILTTYSSLEELGYDYNFKTQFYVDGQNNLYIKLGADPTLTSGQLKQAIQRIKSSGNSTFKNLYIDDSILDKKEFSQGWMWDDDINPYTPKVSAYNLDGNLISINLTKNSGDFATSSVKPNYPMAVKNYVKMSSDIEALDIERYNWLNPEVVEIVGFLKDKTTVKVPISNMRRYFIFNTKKSLDEARISITGTSFASRIVPDGSKLVDEIVNPIKPVIPAILQNSNNLMSETLFKLAANKKYNSTGSDILAIALFNDFYDKLGVNPTDVIIKDGCGVSRNNLFTVNWITKSLVKLSNEKNFDLFKDNMAQAGDGTLSSRLFDLRGNAWLKTGSLSNISAIAGYINSEDGHKYAVSVIVQNFKGNQKDAKNFEDKLIKLIYSR